MLSDSEKKVVEQYFAELRDLSHSRTIIELKMNRVETGIRAILALSSDEEVMPYLERLDDIVRPEGFTDAVRRVLRSSEEALTPAEVREKLPGAGFFLTDYSNPLASIHTILKRLAKTEQVKIVLKGDKTAYQFVLQTQHPAHQLGKTARFGRPRTVPPPPGLSEFPNPLGKTLGEMLTPPKKK
jgi:hypothetical protein